MKTIIDNNIQWFLTSLLMIISLNAFSQKTITWKGGTPGMKNEWYCPQNWSTSSVPDEFSDVTIADVSTSSFALPIIRSGKVEINSLSIKFNASLIVTEDALLEVLGYVEGNCKKNIYGKGEIVLLAEDSTVNWNRIAVKR